MTLIGKIALAVVLLARASVAAPEPPSDKLPPTALLAHDARKDLPTPATVKPLFTQVQGDIGSFIIRQNEAYPSISEGDLQKQLATALPIVFAAPWGPKRDRRVIVVAYCVWFGFYGRGGYETVLERYIWERDRGVRRGASLVFEIGPEGGTQVWSAPPSIGSVSAHTYRRVVHQALD